MTAGLRVEQLRRNHHVDDFTCGRDQLDSFLRRFAWPNQQANASKTYVVVYRDQVVGFHTLAVGEVAHENAGDRLIKGLARHPVPVMLLARLAVSVTMQGRGIGAGLLKDAALRTLNAAAIAGIRALVVHAKDDDARRFYAHFGFTPSPTDPYHLYRLTKDLAEDRP